MKRLLSALALSTLVVLGACGGDSSTAPTSSSMAGNWSLQTVNGANLPFTVYQSGTDQVDITSDVITFSASGSFTEATETRTTSNGQTTTQSDASAGTYVLSGTAITLTWSDGSTGTASVSGTTMTATESGYAMVFKKQ